MPITEDATFNEQVILTVRGANLYGSYYGVYRVDDGEVVEYAPLGGTYDALEYILQQDGEYRVVANGKVVRRVSLTGIILPAQVWSGFTSVIKRDTDMSYKGIHLSRLYGFCINYPFRMSESYPYCLIQSWPYDAGIMKDVTAVNADIVARRSDLVIVTPIDFSKPVLLLWKSYFIWIGNYGEY